MLRLYRLFYITTVGQLLWSIGCDSLTQTVNTTSFVFENFHPTITVTRACQTYDPGQLPMCENLQSIWNIIGLNSTSKESGGGSGSSSTTRSLISSSIAASSSSSSLLSSAASSDSGTASSFSFQYTTTTPFSSISDASTNISYLPLPTTTGTSGVSFFLTDETGEFEVVPDVSGFLLLAPRDLASSIAAENAMVTTRRLVRRAGTAITITSAGELVVVGASPPRKCWYRRRVDSVGTSNDYGDLISDLASLVRKGDVTAAWILNNNILNLYYNKAYYNTYKQSTGRSDGSYYIKLGKVGNRVPGDFVPMQVVLNPLPQPTPPPPPKPKPAPITTTRPATTTTRFPSSALSSSTTSSTTPLPDPYDVITSYALQLFCVTLLGYTARSVDSGTFTISTESTSTSISTSVSVFTSSSLEIHYVANTTTYVAEAATAIGIRGLDDDDINTPTLLTAYPAGNLSSACSRAVSPMGVYTSYSTTTSLNLSITQTTTTTITRTTTTSVSIVSLIDVPVETQLVSGYLQIIDPDLPDWNGQYLFWREDHSYAPDTKLRIGPSKTTYFTGVWDPVRGYWKYSSVHTVPDSNGGSNSYDEYITYTSQMISSYFDPFTGQTYYYDFSGYLDSYYLKNILESATSLPYTDYLFFTYNETGYMTPQPNQMNATWQNTLWACKDHNDSTGEPLVWFGPASGWEQMATGLQQETSPPEWDLYDCAPLTKIKVVG
ncbi:hypothetical protein AA313_de0206412 [Arthrobotrys entomopaga]|nr:hypothetical protein AA313_de0206412 [Arthrobotrys entomopaga]